MDDESEELVFHFSLTPSLSVLLALFFTEARQNEGRRPYPWVTPRLEMISFGSGVVINVSDNILPMLRKMAEGRTRDEVFWAPFVYGPNSYYLPDLERIAPLAKPDGFEYELVEEQNIHKLYQHEGFEYVLHYGGDSPFPEMLIALAKHMGEVAGMASAHAGCKTLRSINVDVLPPYRRKGLASALVNMLTMEVLNRGYVPYYFTSESNIHSLRAAIRAGYSPSWIHCYKTRLDDFPI